MNLSLLICASLFFVFVSGIFFFFLCVFGYKAESLDRCHSQRKRTIFMTYKAIKEGMAEGEGKGEGKLRERE